MDMRRQLARSRSKANSTVRETTPLRLYMAPGGEGGKMCLSTRIYSDLCSGAISPTRGYESKKDRVVTTCRTVTIRVMVDWGEPLIGWETRTRAENARLLRNDLKGWSQLRWAEQSRTAEHTLNHMISLVDIC